MRVDLLLARLVQGLAIRVLLLLSEIANSVCSLVFGPVFLIGCDFDLIVFFKSTLKPGLGSKGKEIFPLKDRVVDELDFGSAMSDFLMIFLSDSSTVVFEAFITFCLSSL